MSSELDVHARQLNMRVNEEVYSGAPCLLEAETGNLPPRIRKIVYAAYPASGSGLRFRFFGRHCSHPGAGDSLSPNAVADGA